MRRFRRHRKRQANELARLLVALDAVSGHQRLDRRRRTGRLSLGRG